MKEEMYQVYLNIEGVLEESIVQKIECQ